MIRIICLFRETKRWRLSPTAVLRRISHPKTKTQFLREVLHQAGGVQVLDGWSITQAQVDGKGGGEVLRQENASFGSTVKPIRKAKNFLQVIFLFLFLYSDFFLVLLVFFFRDSCRRGVETGERRLRVGHR